VGRSPHAQPIRDLQYPLSALIIDCAAHSNNQINQIKEMSQQDAAFFTSLDARVSQVPGTSESAWHLRNLLLNDD
jgi:hypothetical protein